MADVKWIKLTTDIFDDEKILLIESLPDSYAIITVWFKLLCLAGKQNNSGVFMMGQIAYTDKMLATIFRMKETTVTMAIQTFEQFGMVEVIDGVITIPNWNKHQSLDAYEKKKERDRLYQAERRANQRALVAGSNTSATELPMSDWKKVLKEFNHQCAYCGSSEGLEQEHIIPVKDGGKYEVGNIVPACRHCNASKKNKPLIAWYSLSEVFDPERLQHILEYMKSHNKSLDESLDESSCVAVSEEDKERDKDKEERKRKEGKTDFQQIAEMYNATCPSLPSVKALSDARKKAIKARLNTYSLDDFRTLFEKAEASDFLKGSNDRNWTASFDWLIKDANMAKVLEGNYDNKPKTAKGKLGVFQPHHDANAIARMLAEKRREYLKTAANDESIRARAEALKQQFQG